MKLLRRTDPYLLFPSLSISGISIFLLASTTNSLFLPQVIFTLLGLVIFAIFASIDYRIWPKYLYLFYFSSIFLLTVIFFLPEVRGAHRWIDFGIFILQPSEIIKPVIILFYASTLARLKK